MVSDEKSERERPPFLLKHAIRIILPAPPVGEWGWPVSQGNLRLGKYYILIACPHCDPPCTARCPLKRLVCNGFTKIRTRYAGTNASPTAVLNQAPTYYR